MKKIVVPISLAVSLFFILACSLQDSDNNTSKGTGAIVMHAQWPDEMKRIMAPANVVKVKVIVSGADMPDIQKTFNAADGKATIRRVPAGKNRTVTLQGLDSEGIARFEGSKTDITISAGQTIDCGMIVMNPLDSIPPVLDVNATAGDGQVTISWEAVSGAESYNIYMSTATGVSKENYEITVNTVDVSYLWTDLTNGTTCYFVVTAENIYGEGPESTEVSAMPLVTWAKTYGGIEGDYVRFIQQTADGGYIVAGDTDSFGAGRRDIWVLKLNADGTVAWQKTYGGAEGDYARFIQQTADGGYIVAGDTDSFGAGRRDIWILKLNADGAVAWQKTYGETEEDNAESIQQTADGGYIVAGGTYSFGAGIRDMWVLKLNADGAVAWQKTYGGTEWDYARFIQQTADGEYIVAGDTESFGAGSWDMWVLKLNADGAVAWQKTFGGTEVDYAQCIQQTADRGYIVAGGTESFGASIRDMWVLKLNADGAVAWQKTFGETEWDDARFIQQTADGGYIVAGETYSFSVGNYDIWILKLNADGAVAWQKTFGGTGGDSAESIRQTADGGYIVAGDTESFGAGSWDIWVLKLGQDGYLGCSFGVDSSALIFDSGVSGSNTDATGINTSATGSSSSTSGQNSTAVVKTQCQ